LSQRERQPRELTERKRAPRPPPAVVPVL